MINEDDPTMLTGVHVGPGSVNIGLQGGACHLLAEAFADQFAESGAENYLEMSFTTNDRSKHPGVEFTVTLRRKDRKTPHQLRAEAEAQLAQAQERIADLEHALKSAATSLETISRLAGRTHYLADDGGENIPTHMGEHHEVRAYATARARVARDYLIDKDPTKRLA